MKRDVSSHAKGHVLFFLPPTSLPHCVMTCRLHPFRHSQTANPTHKPMKRSFSFEGGRRAWNRSKCVRTTAILILWLTVSLGNAADVGRDQAADTVMKILVP